MPHGVLLVCVSTAEILFFPVRSWHMLSTVGVFQPNKETNPSLIAAQSFSALLNTLRDSFVWLMSSKWLVPWTRIFLNCMGSEDLKSFREQHPPIMLDRLCLQESG